MPCANHLASCFSDRGTLEMIWKSWSQTNIISDVRGRLILPDQNRSMLCEKGVATQFKTAKKVHHCGQIHSGEIHSGEIGCGELKCDTQFKIGGLHSTKVQKCSATLNEFIVRPSLNFGLGGGRRRRRRAEDQKQWKPVLSFSSSSVLPLRRRVASFKGGLIHVIQPSLVLSYI